MAVEIVLSEDELLAKLAQSRIQGPERVQASDVLKRRASRSAIQFRPIPRNSLLAIQRRRAGRQVEGLVGLTSTIRSLEQIADPVVFGGHADFGDCIATFCITENRSIVGIIVGLRRDGIHLE